MDNQKDQFGTTPDQTNASRNPNSSATSGASRKPASAPGTPVSMPEAPAIGMAATPNTGSDHGAAAGQTNAKEDTLLDTALSSGKKWIENSGVLNNVNQLPQSIKDLGNRALGRVNSLSTTQKVVGGAILAAGLGWLATRKGKSSDSSSSYNYGRQRDAGSYGRKSSGYQVPDASTSRSDSGSPYGNSSSRFGSSGRDDSGAAYGHASARTDHGTQSAGSDHSAKSTDYRSID